MLGMEVPFVYSYKKEKYKAFRREREREKFDHLELYITCTWIGNSSVQNNGVIYGVPYHWQWWWKALSVAAKRVVMWRWWFSRRRIDIYGRRSSGHIYMQFKFSGWSFCWQILAECPTCMTGYNICMCMWHLKCSMKLFLPHSLSNTTKIKKCKILLMP